MTAALDTPLSPSNPAPTLWSRLVPYIGMAVVAVLVWLPFSFKTTGLLEELGATEMLDNGAQLFFITPYATDLGQVRSRPLQWFPTALAHALDSNSYIVYNLFIVLFTLGKMVATYWLILKFLPGKKLLAFLTGVLFVLYPADTGLFSIRIIHGHFSVMAYLFAVYFLIQFWEHQGRKRGLALLGMVVALMFTVWQYQIALAACFITPVVLLYFTRPTKRFFIAAGTWYVTLALLLVYSLWAASQSTTSSYEGALLPSGISVESIGQMVYALLIGYLRQIVAWGSAVGKLSYLAYYGVYVLAGVVIVAFVGWWIIRQQRRGTSPLAVSGWRYAILWLGGVAFFAVGVATFIPIPSRQLQEYRIYLLALLGSAWVLVLSLYLISRLVRRYQNALFITLTLPFIGLALVNAMQQQQYYTNFSLEQQSLVQQVVAQVPAYKPGTQIVLLDEAGLMDRLYVYYFGIYWRTALRYIYNDHALDAYYCPPEGGTIALSAACTLETADVRVSNYEPWSLAVTTPVDSTVSYRNAILFRTTFDRQVQLITAEEARTDYNIEGYDPQPLIVQADPPYRVTTLFSCNPALSCYRPPPPVTSLDLDLQQEIGMGWRGAEPAANGNGVFQWSTKRVTSVEVNLNPDHDYQLTFKALAWIVDDATMDGLKLAVNGHDIPLTFSPDESSGRIYSAVIPRTALADQTISTVLVFTLDHISPVPTAPDVKLGFALNWLRIRLVS